MSKIIDKNLKSWFTHGWATYKNSWKVLIPSVIIVNLLYKLFDVFRIMPGEKGYYLYFSMEIIIIPFFLTSVLSIGLAYLSLKAVRKERPGFGVILSGFKCYFNSVGTALLYGIFMFFALIPMIVVGLIAGLIMGISSSAGVRISSILISIPFGLLGLIFFIYIITRYSLCYYAMMDKKLSPMDSIKFSKKITAGHIKKIFVLGFLGFLFILPTLYVPLYLPYSLGAYIKITMLTVSIFVCLPWINVCYASVYESLLPEGIQEEIETEIKS